MGLDRLTKKELISLAEENGIEVDKRLSNAKIAGKLERAGVSAPAEPLSERIAREPVRFIAQTGSIWVRNDTHEYVGGLGDRVVRHGLQVKFETNGEPVGGFSREFDPTDENHRPETNLCSCAQCLEDVRDYIARDPFGVCEREGVREVTDADAPMPFPRWNDVGPGDLADAHERFGFDLERAVRFERENLDRPAIIKELDRLAAEAAAGPDDGDILSAVVEV